MLKKTVLAGALALSFAPADANAQSCDLSDLPCARDGKKCNIKFKNFTGVSEKMCKGNSTSAASVVNVKAKDDNGKDLGNTLSIGAGESGTINLSKKKKANTSRVIVGGTGYGRVSLNCKEIRQVLSGSGKCKIYRKETGSGDEYFVYYVILDCDQGNVCESSQYNQE